MGHAGAEDVRLVIGRTWSWNQNPSIARAIVMKHMGWNQRVLYTAMCGDRQIEVRNLNVGGFDTI